MITYEEIKGRRGSWEIRVRLNGKWAGTIKLVEGGFRYFPKGAKRRFAGELFKTVREVQVSLEGDNTDEQFSKLEASSNDQNTSVNLTE